MISRHCVMLTTPSRSRLSIVATTSRSGRQRTNVRTASTTATMCRLAGRSVRSPHVTRSPFAVFFDQRFDESPADRSREPPRSTCTCTWPSSKTNASGDSAAMAETHVILPPMRTAEIRLPCSAVSR